MSDTASAPDAWLRRREAMQLAADMKASAALWLAENCDALIADVAAHAHLYRLPFALSIAGHTARASDVMERFRAGVIDGNGDLGDGPLRDRFATRWSSYPLALLACGAHALGDTTLAERMVDRLRGHYVDPRSGGAYGERPEHRSSDRQDLFPTAQIGLTAQLLGADDLVESSARWVTDLWEAQEHLPVMATSTQGGSPIADDDREHEASGLLRMAEERQAYAAPGIAAALLARRYRDTGKEEVLDAARGYLDLYDHVHPSAWDATGSVQICKFAWGAAELLRATGEVPYEDRVLRMVAWFSSGISASGSWVMPASVTAWGTADRRATTAELTAEFIQHLASCLTALEEIEAASRSNPPLRPKGEYTP